MEVPNNIREPKLYSLIDDIEYSIKRSFDKDLKFNLIEGETGNSFHQLLMFNNIRVAGSSADFNNTKTKEEFRTTAEQNLYKQFVDYLLFSTKSDPPHHFEFIDLVEEKYTKENIENE